MTLNKLHRFGVFSRDNLVIGVLFSVGVGSLTSIVHGQFSILFLVVMHILRFLFCWHMSVKNLVSHLKIRGVAHLGCTVFQETS